MVKVLGAVFNRNPAWIIFAVGVILILISGSCILYKACVHLESFLFWEGLVLVAIGIALVGVHYFNIDEKSIDE